MLKLGKNLSWDFEVIYIFRKNAVLNIYRYLKGFYTYKKMNKIFLKFHHIKDTKNHRNRLKNANQKHNQHTYK